MKVRSIKNYKDMRVGNIYETKISRNGQYVNVVIDKNTQYSFYRYRGSCNFRSDNDDINFIEYLKGE